MQLITLAGCVMRDVVKQAGGIAVYIKYITSSIHQIMRSIV